jgi:hypothetical protein
MVATLLLLMTCAQCRVGSIKINSDHDIIIDWWVGLNIHCFQCIGAPAAASQSLPPYYYRYYSTQNVYLGVNTHDNHVYYLDADNTLSDVGPLSKWLPLAGCK